MKDEGRRDIKENSKLPTFYATDSSLGKPNKKNKETERETDNFHSWELC